ncbi:MAG: orotate phosphoribosyltransferase [Thermomicrobiales bacterium]|nr:orotate phosphoribosyltransferase [Thermomicrobiales bacterium]
MIEIGALKEGHFLLASGLHSDRYIEKFDLLRNPSATSELLGSLASRFRDERIDVVAGPTTGGILLAFELARQLGVASAYAERVSDGGSERTFKRGTTFAAGSRVLVIDDILTTGGSVRETLAALAKQPVEVVAVAVLVDRSAGKVQFPGVPLIPLVSMNVDAWSPDVCPLCAAGVPVVKPGSTAAPES